MQYFPHSQYITPVYLFSLKKKKKKKKEKKKKENQFNQELLKAHLSVTCIFVTFDAVRRKLSSLIFRSAC